MPALADDISSATAASIKARNKERKKYFTMLSSFDKLIKSGDVETCLQRLRVYAEASKDPRPFNHALKLLPPASALAVWQIMRDKGIKPTAYTASFLAENLAAGKMHRLLDSVMQGVLKDGARLHWSLFFRWADSYANHGDASGVRRVMAVAQQHGIEITPHYYTILVKATCKLGNPHKAAYILDEMKRAGIEPTENVYRTLIYCLGSWGHPDKAKNIFYEMQTAGIAPTLETYGALINAYSDSGRVDCALATLEEMHAKGFKANERAYAALAKGFSKNGDIEKARAILDEMKRYGLAPNKFIWSCIVEACATARRPEAALTAISDAAASGVQPDVLMYTSLLSAYRNAGDVEGGKAVLDLMKAAGCPPSVHTYTELMVLLGKDGRAEEVEDVFTEILNSGISPDLSCYAVFIDAFMIRWKLGRSHSSSDEWLHRAEEAFAEAIQGPMRNTLKRVVDDGSVVVADMHGHSGWSVQLAILRILNEVLNRRVPGVNYALKAPCLHIITGRGNRSNSSSPIIREVSLKFLQPILPVRLGAKNDGAVIVSASGLGRLLAFMRSEGNEFDLKSMRHYLVDPDECVPI